jgi:hypothetical protein
MYWFRDPIDQALREWRALSDRCTELGRMPGADVNQALLSGMFTPLKGYVNPSVRISPDAIPFRPVRSVYITVTELDPDPVASQDMKQWYDETRVPDLLECRGVAGAWSLASDPALSPTDASPHAAPPGVHIHLYYLDDDAAEVMQDMEERQSFLRRAGRHHRQADEREIFTGFAAQAVPWRLWDWTEGA